MSRCRLAVLAAVLALLIRAATINAGSLVCQIQNAEPDPTCTPGAVFPVTASQVCVRGYASSVRDVTEAEKRAVYAEYGLGYPQAAGAFEVDHLISLELGGSNDIPNLWPEAASPTPGFHQKDVLENYLHDQVCSGAMSLPDAQATIAADWLSAWYAAGQPGAGNTITALPPQVSAGTIPATVLAQPASDGHTYYASSYRTAMYIYCDTDPGWQELSPRDLRSFSSLAEAMATLPG